MKPANLIPLLIALLAIAAGVFWWNNRGADEKPSVPGSIPGISADGAAQAADGAAAPSEEPVADAAQSGEATDVERTVVDGQDEGAAAAVPGNDAPWLRVRVVDSRDQPVANARVEGALLIGDGPPLGIHRGVSRADGTVAFESAFPPIDFDAPEAGHTQIKLWAPMPFAERPEVQVPIATARAEGVVLTLPPSGALEVILDHPDRSRLVDATVRLRLRDAPVSVLHDSTSQVVDASGTATFEHVGVGLRLHLEGRMAAGNLRAELETTGPRAPGERIRVRIPMLTARPVLVAEIRNENNELVRSKNLDIQMSAKLDGSHTMSHFNADTDAKGRMALVLSDDFTGPAERSLQFILEGEPSRTVFVELPPIKPGENDLGILTMAPPPLLAAGRIVGSDGAPVPQAQVSIRRKESYDAAGHYWAHTNVPDATTDKSGAFKIDGILDATEVALEAEAAGYLPVSAHEFPKGARNVQIVLDRAAALTGEVVLPEGFAHTYTKVDVLDTTTQHSVADSTLRRQGRFEFASLRPGNVRLRVRLYGFAEPAYLSEPITVTAGQRIELGEIQLTSEVHQITFRIVDPQGQLVHSAEAVVRQSDEQSRFEGLILTEGTGTLLAPAATADLIVFGEGLRTVHALGVQDGANILIQRAAEVVFRIPAGLELPANAEVAIALSPTDHPREASTRIELRSDNSSRSMSGGTRPWLESQRLVLDRATGRATGTVPFSGRCAVRVEVAQHGRRRWSRAETEQTIEIADQVGAQTFTAALTQEQFDAAWQQVQ